MRSKRAFLPLALLLSFGCASGPKVDDGVFPLVSTSEKYHRLRYRDGQTSPNDSCMILLANKLNPRIPPAYINGRPHGFC